MKNITTEEKRLWLGSSNPKDLIITLTPPTQSGGNSITLTNSDILSESLEITQILESGKTLSFGDVNASSLNFKCRDFETDVRGWKLEAVLKFKDYPQYSQKVFVGYVYNQANQNHEDVTTTITAYDPIKTIFSLDLTKWWDDLTIAKNSTFETYCARIINKLASDVGCGSFDSQDIDRLANRKQIIESKPDLITDFQTISGEMLIKWIAQATNVYIQYDSATNKLKAVKLKLMGEALVPNIGLHPRIGLYPSAGVLDLKLLKSEYISATYEPYKTEKIDQVIITDKGDIGEGQYPVQSEQGNSVLFLDGNPFLWSMNMMQCAETIYNRVHDVYFTPSTIQTSGTVFMELGDVLKVYTVKNIIQSYILKRTMKGINSIKDTFTNKSEQYQVSHNPSYADVTDLQSQSILKIKADIVEMNKIVAEKIDAEYIKTAKLNADNINTGTLDCKNVTVKNLKVTNSMISEKIKAENIDVSKIKVTDSMISGTITTSHLDSSVITTKNFSSQSISASKITSGKLSADYIEGGTLNCKNLSVSNLTFSNVGGSIAKSQISADVFSGYTVKAKNFSVPSDGRFNLGDYSFAASVLYYLDHNGNKRTKTVLVGQ